MSGMLLLLFCLATGAGVVVGIFLRHAASRERMMMPRPPVPPPPPQPGLAAVEGVVLLKRPTCWLAVKGRSLLAVKTALGVANVKPCAVADALETEPRIFITPPFKGWVLVLGSDLPVPADDVDACFRFIVAASRKLGHVQFFSANLVLNHHAWIRAEKGRIQRAYAWAGRTLWNQGPRTPAEQELDLACLDYCCELPPASVSGSDPAGVNTEKVPQLAARWSLDPGSLEPQVCESVSGLAGEVASRF